MIFRPDGWPQGRYAACQQGDFAPVQLHVEDGVAAGHTGKAQGLVGWDAMGVEEGPRSLRVHQSPLLLRGRAQGAGILLTPQEPQALQPAGVDHRRSGPLHGRCPQSRTNAPTLYLDVFDLFQEHSAMSRGFGEQAPCQRRHLHFHQVVAGDDAAFWAPLGQHVEGHPGRVALAGTWTGQTAVFKDPARHPVYPAGSARVQGSALQADHPQTALGTKRSSSGPGGPQAHDEQVDLFDAHRGCTWWPLMFQTRS